MLDSQACCFLVFLVDSGINKGIQLSFAALLLFDVNLTVFFRLV